MSARLVLTEAYRDFGGQGERGNKPNSKPISVSIAALIIYNCSAA